MHQGHAALGLERCAEAFERRVRGLQLQDSRRLVAAGPMSHGQVSACLRSLERQIGFGPPIDGLPELGDPSHRVALVHQHGSQRLMRTRLPQRGVICGRDLA